MTPSKRIVLFAPQKEIMQEFYNFASSSVVLPKKRRTELWKKVKQSQKRLPACGAKCHIQLQFH